MSKNGDENNPKRRPVLYTIRTRPNPRPRAKGEPIMMAADFEENLAKLIAKTMTDENNETIREYAEYQLSKMDEYKTRKEYAEAMKL